MKNKHGFTLIELLAVIVVLAIIALIATPIVINTINNAKRGAAERSGENYIKQVEVAIATKRLDESTSNLSSLDGTYEINSEGNLEGSNLTEPLVIEMSGDRPTSGTIVVKDGEVQNSSSMIIGDYDVSYDETKNKYVALKLETYKITYNLTNVTGDNITSITTKGLTLKFNVSSGYTFKDSVTVTGATYTWDKETGTLILSNVTGDVTVTIVGENIITFGYNRWINSSKETITYIKAEDGMTWEEFVASDYNTVGLVIVNYKEYKSFIALEGSNIDSGSVISNIDYNTQYDSMSSYSTELCDPGGFRTHYVKPTDKIIDGYVYAIYGYAD